MEKQCAKYETTLFMPHVSGQPPTNRPMQVPMGESNTESVPTPITQTIVFVIFIYSSFLCRFGQQNFLRSHRGSLTPSDIFRAFTGGYAVKPGFQAFHLRWVSIPYLLCPTHFIFHFHLTPCDSIWTSSYSRAHIIRHQTQCQIGIMYTHPCNAVFCCTPMQ